MRILAAAFSKCSVKLVGEPVMRMGGEANIVVVRSLDVMVGPVIAEADALVCPFRSTFALATNSTSNDDHHLSVDNLPVYRTTLPSRYVRGLNSSPVCQKSASLSRDSGSGVNFRMPPGEPIQFSTVCQEVSMA